MQLTRNRYWPADFTDGEAVIYLSRNAHVVAVPVSLVPEGCVPVMFDDEGGCFVIAPADDLSRR